MQIIAFVFLKYYRVLTTTVIDSDITLLKPEDIFKQNKTKIYSMYSRK